MSTTPDLTQAAVAAPARRSVLGLMVRNPLALTGLVVLAIVVLVAIFAGVLAPGDPLKTNLQGINAPPGTPGHPLGADGAGRDILSRLLFGSRLTLVAASLTVVVAVAIGVPTGLVAGYYGRVFDAIASWVADVFLSVPGMVILLAVIAAFGPSVTITMTAFGVVLAPQLFRLVRAQVMAVKNDLYVDAARVSGLSDPRIVGRHVLSVVRAPVIIQSAIIAGIAIIVQSGLEFLGLGDPSQPTWGSMLGNAFQVIYLSPTAMIWPGLAIGVTVAALVLVGNGLRDAVQGVKGSPRRRRPPALALEGTDATKQKRSIAASVDDGAPRRARTERSDTADDASSELSLEVRDLKVGYPRPDGGWTVVVENASLQVRRGQVLGLVGESGSGKTQTAFAVLGLLPRDGTVLAGSIRIGGAEVLDQSGRVRRRLLGRTIAYVPQEPMSNLDPAFRVGQQLTEPLVAHGMSRSAAKRHVLELLAEVGIPDPPRTFRAYPHQISGGMAQRVLIAGAISGDPDLLIADEPTTALDVTVQAEVLALLRRLQKDRQMAMLLVTHNLGVVADICDDVAVMREGEVVETAPVSQLFSSPRHEYTQMLLASTLDDAEPRAVREARAGASTLAGQEESL